MMINPRYLALAWALCAAAPAAAQKADPADNIAGPYVPTPWAIVDEMMKLAEIRGGDVVYDLGSGDGRLVITAAKRFGARGVGVELDPQLVETARIGAKDEGVAERVRFVQGDLFEASIGDASVVMLYLLPRFVTRLVPKLRAELRPGARIISHDYPLVPWRPDKELSMDVPEKEMISGTTWTRLYYYVVPARVQGVWELALPKNVSGTPLNLRIAQDVHAVSGVIRDGGSDLHLRDLAIRGERIQFGLLYKRKLMTFEGTVNGKSMAGELRSGTAREPWTASYRGPLAR